MAEISANMVKDLREKTGAGMMDCKSALSETKGDVDAAIDWLRKKGLAKAAKKAGRVAAEGLVGVAVTKNAGVAVEVNSETDFVARNPEFQEMVTQIAGIALKHGSGNAEAVKAASYPGAGSVAEKIAAMVAKIGENMTLRRVAPVKVGQGAIGSYVHNQTAPGMGKIGVLVGLESAGNADELARLGKMLAMHVAAANPVAVDSTGVDAKTLEHERTILSEKAKASGKPANVIEKIVDSGIKTFFKEVCLVEQAYVHDPAKTVAQAVKEAEGRAGAPIKIAGFVRYALGEGIEKQESDFAAEVKAAAKI